MNDQNAAFEPPIRDPGPTHYQSEPPPQKSWVPSCLMGCGIMLLIVVIVGASIAFFLARNYRTYSSKFARAGIVKSLDSFDLPNGEKERIVGEVDRLFDAYKQKKISNEDLFGVIEDIARSNIMSFVMLQALEAKYIEPSGLSDEEKQDAAQVIQRFAKGVIDRKIDETEINPILDLVSDKQADGSRRVKNNLSDDELRELVAECKRLADEAEIEAAPEAIDIANELKRIVDDALVGMSE